jgi:hypothetical protein
MCVVFTSIYKLFLEKTFSFLQIIIAINTLTRNQINTFKQVNTFKQLNT